MAKKGKKIDNRTVLIILIVLAIIGAGYIIITNLPEEINSYTPDEIKKNKSNFLNQTVTVKGYYDTNANQPIIVSTMSNPGEREELKLDYSNIPNATDDLRSGTVYYFTGTIVQDPDSIIFDVILIADKIERV